MAWITPKTDWLASDGVANTDMNRIEGNTLEIYNTYLMKGPNVVQIYAGTAAPNNDDTYPNGTIYLKYV